MMRRIPPPPRAHSVARKLPALRRAAKAPGRRAPPLRLGAVLAGLLACAPPWSPHAAPAAGAGDSARSSLDSAWNLLRTGRPAEARILAEAWLGSHPGDVDAHRLRQDALRAGAAGIDLKREYKARLDSQPRDPERHYLYGRTLDCRRALPHYRKAVALDSCSAWGHIGVGVCQFEQGSYRRAESTFRHILSCREGFPEAYRNLIQTLVAAGDPAGARQAADELLAQHPSSGEAWEWKGDLDLQERKADEALSAYRKAMARGSLSAELLFKMGYAAFTAQRWRDAVSYYRKSVEYGRSDYGVHFNLAASCEKAEFGECAISHYRKAVEIRPEGEARVPLANSLSAAGLYDEAVTHYELALRRNSRDADALFGLGNALHSKGDIAKAEKVYRLLLSRDSDHSKANYNLGSLYAYHRRDLKAAGTYWHTYLKQASGEDRDKLLQEMRRLGIP